MIPLRDDNPTRRFPIVTVLLVVANVLVFVWESTLSPAQLQALANTWAVVPSRLLADPFSPREAATVVAAMFLHGGWLHVLGNMLYLWIFGNNIEDRLGHVGFVGFYLASGVAATAAQVAMAPATDVPLLGASGAVAGVLGAYALLYPGAAVLTLIPIFFFFEIARLPALLVIGVWFLVQLGNGLGSLSPEFAQTGGVAWFAHIGGFLAGLTLILPVWAYDRSKKRNRGRGWH
ncbi:MAG: rhomboid family intramembrane serine protease [Anaerosomatales bacterium]|nr:rhomboid family intramembrane serine protease [Anaerosomatales bacterium]